MIQKYLYTFLLTLIFCFADAQEKPSDNLSFYPNPVANGKIFISSKTNTSKEITIFDILGKQIFGIETTSKELNIGVVSPGVYIIKISDGENTVTRKLIIK